MFIVAVLFAILMNISFSDTNITSSTMDLVGLYTQTAQGEEGGGYNTCYATSNSGGNTDTTRCAGCTPWDDRKKLKDPGNC